MSFAVKENNKIVHGKNPKTPLLRLHWIKSNKSKQDLLNSKTKRHFLIGIISVDVVVQLLLWLRTISRLKLWIDLNKCEVGMDNKSIID